MLYPGSVVPLAMFFPGEGVGILPEKDQVKEGQINVILSDSDPLKSFWWNPVKILVQMWPQSGIPFRGRHGENHEGRQGRPAAFGQVRSASLCHCLLLSHLVSSLFNPWVLLQHVWHSCCTSGMQEERQLSWSPPTRELATSLSGGNQHGTHANISF